MGEDRETRRVYSPGDVAERLGVSGQRLRQLARVYERFHGDLPRDERGRLWPEESVEELERARDLVQAGRATGIEQALRGELTPGGVEPYPATREAAASEIAALAVELRALREAIESQNRILEAMTGRLEALEGENRELRAALPGSPGPGEGPHQDAPRDEPRSPESAGEEPGGTEIPETAPPPEAAPQRRSWWRRVFGA